MKKLLTLVVLLSLIAACGGSSSDTTAGDTTPAAATTEAAPDTAPATTQAMTDTTGGEASENPRIVISGMSFSGPSTVSVGDTIEIVNMDEVPHTWTAEDGPFDVSVGPGQTATYTFEEAGEFPYFCKLHPSMTGTITVEG
ncbi:MAG TPA: cupredoxin domain-containing protein [Acidimicrobiia bacterium]